MEKHGGRVVTRVADVRDRAALAAAVDDGVAQLGRLDGVVAQACICPLGTTEPRAFVDAIAVDFGGVFNAVDVALPHLGRGASIVATGSLAALIPGTLDNAAKGSGGLGYSWAKRAVASLVHDLAVVLAPKGIRANAVHPTNVNTDLMHNEVMYKTFRPDLAAPTLEDVLPAFPAMTATGDPYIEPEDDRRHGGLPAQRRVQVRHRDADAGRRGRLRQAAAAAAGVLMADLDEGRPFARPPGPSAGAGRMASMCSAASGSPSRRWAIFGSRPRGPRRRGPVCAMRSSSGRRRRRMWGASATGCRRTTTRWPASGIVRATG